MRPPLMLKSSALFHAWQSLVSRISNNNATKSALYVIAADASNRRVSQLGYYFPCSDSNFLRAGRTLAFLAFFTFFTPVTIDSDLDF